MVFAANNFRTTLQIAWPQLAFLAIRSHKILGLLSEADYCPKRTVVSDSDKNHNTHTAHSAHLQSAPSSNSILPRFSVRVSPEQTQQPDNVFLSTYPTTN